MNQRTCPTCATTFTPTHSRNIYCDAACRKDEHAKIAGLPDPEHVIPLSRGGSNSMANIVAACRACNGDKRDLTPDEWALDRMRRGLLPVDTSLSGPAFSHLVKA